MLERRALRRFFFTSAMTLSALASVGPAHAQTISGTIREANGGPFISGGFVTLVTETGEAVQADFTTIDGAFTLVAPGPGQYRVRVERIGYQEWLSEPYTLETGSRETVLVEIPPQPVSLVDLQVEVVGSCLDDPRQGAELAQVWDEARKALESAVWAERLGQVTFTLTEYERTLEPSSLAVRESESRRRERVRLPPFESVPVEELVESGYAILSRDSAVYYAPDASVLLSQEFQDTHCFGLRREEMGETSMLGITFAPRDARSVVEVEGTLWIDAETAELSRVQLIYRNVPLPREADRRLVGADLTFDRLPDGPFFVREWWIRFPIVGTVARIGVPTSQDSRQSVLVAYRQTGGAVTDAFVGDARLESGLGVVTGMVRDSGSAQGLSRAEVIMRDWDDAAAFLPDPLPGEAYDAVSDGTGAFSIVNVPDGTYAVRVDHPRLRAAGLRLQEQRVTVDDGEAPVLSLNVPSEEEIYPLVCPGAPLDKARGAIAGFVRDRATGQPVAGREVEALWRVRRITVTASGDPQVSDLSQGTGAVSDAEGRFVVCEIPVGEQVRLRPTGGGEEVTLEQDARILWRDLPVDP